MTEPTSGRTPSRRIGYRRSVDMDVPDSPVMLRTFFVIFGRRLFSVSFDSGRIPTAPARPAP